MNRLAVLTLGFLLIGAGAAVRVYRADIDWLNRDTVPAPLTEQAAREALKGMPLVFQENQGQVDNQVKYLVRNSATSLFFTENEIVYQLTEAASSKAVALRQTFVGGLAPYTVQGEVELKSKVNYFIGNDESNWVQGAPTFSSVRYKQMYEGIDLVYDGSLGRLDYRYEIQPGANPDDIRMRIEGADSLALAEDGALVFVTPLGNMGLPKPRAMQQGKSISSTVQYRLVDETTFTIELGAYDVNALLIIITSQEST